MKPIKKKRLLTISLIFATFAGTIGLTLYAMQNDLNHYYSLESIAKKEVPIEQPGIRIGGMVENGSIEREGNTLTVHFKVTDFQNKPLTVTYTGILPDLFREQQGVIARGRLGNDGIFYADQILAKHDENYMPPELKADMGKTGYQHKKNPS